MSENGESNNPLAYPPIACFEASVNTARRGGRDTMLYISAHNAPPPRRKPLAYKPSPKFEVIVEQGPQHDTSVGVGNTRREHGRLRHPRGCQQTTNEELPRAHCKGHMHQKTREF